MTSLIEQAACWFLNSGIQEEDGGVARFYRSDAHRNAAVSTEITGYTASTFAFFHSLDGRPEYLDALRRAARYLTDCVWNDSVNGLPFEPGSPHSYFFDTGIIARGLLAAHRATGEELFLKRARQVALSLAFDFLGDGFFHPVITLPDKQPLGDQSRWSRRPGCYQLKSALVWREIGDPQAARMFEVALAQSLATHDSFLTEAPTREELMDRLHAYCYFLESLISVADRPEIREVLSSGISRVAHLLREISPQFERSDVCAQLLRVRLIAHHDGFVSLDEESAEEEASRAASYACDSPDPHLRGGFWFGKKGDGVLPFMNPVSTAFCAQALSLWEQHRAGAWRFELCQLI